jgi:hypothetical protein
MQSLTAWRSRTWRRARDAWKLNADKESGVNALGFYDDDIVDTDVDGASHGAVYTCTHHRRRAGLERRP